MATHILAPHPAPVATLTLPSAEFRDTRRTEARIDLIHSAMGDLRTYVQSSDFEELILDFQLTTAKHEELKDFIAVYDSSEMQLIMYDDSRWAGNLTGSEVVGVTRGRVTGISELIEVALTFSMKAI